MDELRRIPVPTPFRVGDVDCYVIDAGQLTVVDPGPKTEAAYETVVEGLATEGYEPRDVDQVLITHPHTDHCGLANRFKHDTGASVLCHEDAVEILTDPVAHYERERAFFESFLVEMGVSEDMAGAATELSGPYIKYFEEPVSVDRQLRHGDTIDAGIELSVVHVPGHAHGCVCFDAPAEGVMLTGDHVLENITPNPFLTVELDRDARTRNLPTYLDSLRLTLEYESTVGYGGHGGRVPDLHRRIREIIEHHEKRCEAILDMIEADGRTTAYDLMLDFFDDLPVSELFLGISEIIGHLDVLEDDGRVTLSESDGVIYYEAT